MSTQLLKSENKPISHLLLLFLITIIVNQFFNLIPDTQVRGVYNVIDAGNFIIGVFLVIFILKAKDLSVFHNVFSWILFLLFIIVGVQVALSGFYYNQPIKSGVIASRHQLYYLSFFLFLLLLDNLARIRQFLNGLSIIAIIILILSIINYFGPVIFYHDWAEGQGKRSGLTRAFIPAMSLVSFAALWEFSKWLGDNSNKKKNGISFLLLLGAHFFRQTRSRIIAILMVILLMIARTFNIKAAAVIGGLILVAVGLGQYLMQENVIQENVFTSSVTSAVEDVELEEGTWTSRMRQIRIQMEIFEEHPILGSGLFALRLGTSDDLNISETKLRYARKDTDTGYTYWLQAFGLVGAIWLLALLAILWIKSAILLKEVNQEHQSLAMLAANYTGFVTISLVTLNHLTKPDGIILLCLNMAIIVRLQEHKNIIKR